MLDAIEKTTFRAVYDEHFRFVWRSLRRLGTRNVDVADAVQDVFLVVYRKLGAFEGRAKMTTWLFGICLRVASDRRRLAYERHQSENDGLMVDPPDDRIDVVCTIERRQKLAMGKKLLDGLPDEQRTVFVLFEFEEMSGEDIAEALGIPLGTVYSRLRLAREAFHQAVIRARAHERSRMERGAAGMRVAGSER